MKTLLSLCFLAYAFEVGNHTFSEETRVYLDAAVEKYLRGDYAGAVPPLQKALELNPDNSKIHQLAIKIYLEGVMDYYSQKKYELSALLLNEISHLEPSHPKIQEWARLLRGDLPPRVSPNLSQSFRREIPRKPSPPPKTNKKIWAKPNRDTLNSLAAIQARPYFVHALVSELRNEIQFFFLLGLGGLYLLKTGRSLWYDPRSDRASQSPSLSDQVPPEERTPPLSEILVKNMEAQLTQLGEELRQKLSLGLSKLGEEFKRMQAKHLENVEQDKPRPDPAGLATFQDYSFLLNNSWPEGSLRLAAQLKQVYQENPLAVREHMQQMLVDSDPKIRAFIAKALPRTLLPELIERLCEIWEKDADPRVKLVCFCGFVELWENPEFLRLPQKLRQRIAKIVQG